MSPTTTYANYNPFARMYNEYWGPKSCKNKLPVLEKLVLHHLPKDASILDLCCGTGQLVQQLLSRGYQVTGLDTSEEMLHYAHQNAPDAKFILEDARLFQQPLTYHAVVSTSVGLNHMMSLEELKSVFKNVYAALLDNGCFLFDLNLEGKFQSYGTESVLTEGDVQDEYAWACRESYIPEEKISPIAITIFHLVEANWQRSDITWLLKAYSKSEIQSALEAVGFSEVIIYDRDGNLATASSNSYAFFMGRKRLNG
ncbi:MAG TPA: class I SAM-dependent methyltransferase [Cyanobacteria bacterium UBA8803]|nr:class I SAM-dependent methyltransferase [Cyanobacteria bacterium UBA9273]HBL59454.1 class I SAM-dependent methyltransferase [Cyanobacteria bacterium UBA8803]